MISISVGLAATHTATGGPSLIVTGLQNGEAVIADSLTAYLSDGTPIMSYAWGSSSGGSEYGSAPVLVVPETAAGGSLFLSVESDVGQFARMLSVAAAPVEINQIIPGTDEIEIQSLAPFPPYDGLTLTPSSNSIIVETACCPEPFGPNCDPIPTAIGRGTTGMPPLPFPPLVGSHMMCVPIPAKTL